MNRKYNLIKKVTYTISFVISIIFIFYVISNGSIKKSSLGDLSYGLLIFQYFGIATFIYGWTSRSKCGKILGGLSILILLIAEARAFAIIGLISVIIIRFYNRKIFSKSTLKISILTIVILIGGFVPRFGSQIMEAKSKGTLIPYLSVMFGSYEWGQIGYNLNSSVNPHYESKHNILSLYASAVPLVNRFYENREMGRFHEHIEKYLNPGFGYALGGTFWGESFVLGGLLGVIFNLLIIFSAIEWLKKRILAGNIFYPLYLLTLVFILFYLPRNDILVIIAVAKNLLIFLIIYCICIFFLTKKSTIIV
jgi:hypothetical protein